MSGQELLELSSKATQRLELIRTETFRKTLEGIVNACQGYARAWSGSNLGYYANVYYNEMSIPPVGARFSIEHGLRERYYSNTVGDWVEVDPHEFRKALLNQNDQEALRQGQASAKQSLDMFGLYKEQALSIIHTFLRDTEDNYLRALLENIENLCPISRSDINNTFIRSGQFISSDTEAMSQGWRLGPHQVIIADTQEIFAPEYLLEQLAKLCQQSGSHILRLEKKAIKQKAVGTNVFIGHGRSFVWRDLKDFIRDRMHLPYDEFNRVPVAGITNIARLSEMLDAAAIAFIVCTAEDELTDGAMQARMNVIHEAGLFQGRLGFTRAIILLEEGCAEFSNIQGLGQIRFPKGNIGAKFEEIRQVLEREGLIDGGSL